MTYEGEIRLKKDVLMKWAEAPDLNEYGIAKKIEFDPGNFSKMVNGKMEPSKTLIKRLMKLTGYSFDDLFLFVRDSKPLAINGNARNGS